jgi:hypothetical protein
MRTPLGARAWQQVHLFKPLKRTVISFDSPDVGGRKADVKKNLELSRDERI